MSQNKRPFVWAHRGASGYAPENTLPAFQMAADMGADGVELDVQLTKDGVLVVCHDETIDRTSTGKGWIKDLTFEELRKLDFFNGNEKYKGVQIPTMEEVFNLLKDSGLTINIEMKNGVVFYENLEEKLVELVHKCGWEDRVIYSSFNHYSVKKLKEIEPTAKVGFLYADGTMNMPEYAKDYGVDALHPALYNIQFPGLMEKCREYGLEVNVWTVNELPYIQMCCMLDVDAIIGNYPDKIREVIEGFGK
ncbi:MAG: glycerophosphodiester phosphodiesterase [Eubacteriales bacterium]|nr:glycerophosphodiester phosphodiesterase [Eubacteriales bacterium]MDY3332729.1 glycerophosphodiester phosphodiesterase [Gallibacter sp.]